MSCKYSVFIPWRYYLILIFCYFYINIIWRQKMLKVAICMTWKKILFDKTILSKFRISKREIKFHRFEPFYADGSGTWKWQRKPVYFSLQFARKCTISDNRSMPLLVKQFVYKLFSSKNWVVISLPLKLSLKPKEGLLTTLKIHHKSPSIAYW